MTAIAITHQSLSQRLAAYPRTPEDAAAGSEVGALNATLVAAQEALVSAEQRFRKVRDRLFTVDRLLGATDETADFAIVAGLMAEQVTLLRLVQSLEADRRIAVAVQTATRARNARWDAAATIRGRIRILLDSPRDDEAIRRWHRDHGQALFATLDRLLGPPAEPAVNIAA